MKYIFLLPGSIALAMAHPQPSTQFKLLGFLPWVSEPTGAMAQKKYLKSLGYLLLAYGIGFLLAWLKLSFITGALAIIHMGCAAVSGAKERKVCHTTLTSAMVLGSCFFEITLAGSNSFEIFNLGTIPAATLTSLNLGTLLVLIAFTFLHLSRFKLSRAPQYESSRHISNYLGLIILATTIPVMPFFVPCLFLFSLFAEKMARNLEVSPA